MTERTLWSKEFLVAIAVNLFMSSVFYLLLTSMAGYAVAEFQASESLAGLAASGFIIGSVVGRLLSGKYLDFVGRRRLLVLTMIAYVLACLAYIPVTDLGVLIAVRLVHGLAFGAGNTALVASVQAVIPPGKRAEGNGYFATATTLSTAVGPFLAVWLGENYGFTSVFLVATACAGATLVAACFFTVPEREPSPEERRLKWSMRLSSFIDRGGLRLGLVMLLAGLAFASVLSFIAVHTADLGIPAASSVFFVSYAVASLFARLFAGRIQDRLGDNIVAIPVFGCFAAGMVLVGLATTTALIAAAGVLIGLGFGCLLPTMQAILVDQVPPPRVGVATSTFFLLLDTGSGVGPVLLGLVGGATGFATMFVLSSGLVVLAAIAYLGFHGFASGGRPARA
ncbi:MFS transporter [Pseudactinotalea sp. HY160]|uniref:MFS transporter n=1 Tax=Pseudactinotalea sp. HY160 TaxID=2654490 RepID=UPI00129C6D0B|nr:MFS transporter [Pseudactinotalea sp. HY160]QGH70932.1 MFS transporter [Pseudactinotalea sp. HY158]